MGISSNALYFDLLQDLSRHITPYVTDQIMAGNVPEIWPDATQEEVACVSLVKSFYKKFIDKTSPNADDLALEKFLHTNQRVGSWSLELESTKDEVLLGELKSILYQFFAPGGDPLVTSFNQLLAVGRCGPGSSVGSLGNDFYTKMFSSPLTATSEGLYSAYAAYISANPSWERAEILRTSHWDEVNIVTGNRLSFVPKSVDISRIICIEPSLNMYFQLGMMHVLNEQLYRYFGIDMSTQPDMNRELARIGSFDQKEGGFVTIDLSEASDSLSIAMLEEVLPAHIMNWFKLLRSPNCRLPNGDELQLNMISTMGNGFTFPLQTILFASAIIAAMRFRHIRVQRPKRNDTGNFAVFGDDLICYKEVASDVVRLLNLLGFKVNSDKSFFEGPFRESCGCDYFRGHNVRGVYIKTLRTPQTRYAMINQLNAWSARQGIYLPRTVRRLKRSVRFLPVPCWENEDAGIRVPFSLISNLRVHKDFQSVIYTRMTPHTRKMKIRDGVVRVPKGEKPRIYNPEGLLQAFLSGSIERGEISVRQRHVGYHPRQGIAPNWDYSTTDRCFASADQRRRWESAVRVNL